MVAHSAGVSETQWKWWARGLGLSHENFSPLHPHLPPDSQNFQALWHASLSSWSHFEYSSTKVGSCDNEPLY